MEITETISRDCCMERDLKKVDGSKMIEPGLPRYKFCVHCGQYWMARRELF